MAKLHCDVWNEGTCSIPRVSSFSSRCDHVNHCRSIDNDDIYISWHLILWHSKRLTINSDFFIGRLKFPWSDKDGWQPWFSCLKNSSRSSFLVWQEMQSLEKREHSLFIDDSCWVALDDFCEDVAKKRVTNSHVDSWPGPLPPVTAVSYYCWLAAGLHDKIISQGVGGHRLYVGIHHPKETELVPCYRVSWWLFPLDEMLRNEFYTLAFFLWIRPGASCRYCWWWIWCTNYEAFWVIHRGILGII